MATLQKLRNRMGVLIAVVIGFALLAFILGDFLSSGSKLLNSKKFEIAEIGGKSVTYQDFQARVESSVENYKRNSGNNSPDESTLVSIRNQVWNTLLNEYIMKDEFAKLGIGCSGDELFDMIQGTNIHPQIKSSFINEVTGEFDRAKVITFLKQMKNDATGRTQASWVEFEKQLMNDRVYTKYQNMIMKGLFVTHNMIESDYYDSQRKFDISYVSKRYSFVPDSVVTVTADDVESYYHENKDDFTQEATRDIAYVTFDVLPSEKDRKLVEAWISNERAEFKRIENAKQYVNLNGDTGFNPVYYAPGELEEPLRAWAEEAQAGDIYGPYFVDEVWKLAKVTDVKMVSDSVRASHILIRVDENNNFEPAQKIADSLVNLINNGADFAALAAEFGTDGTAQSGGDLNWFIQGAMLPEFDKVCFFGNKGDLVTATTQFGVHVINVTDQSPKSRKLQVAILDRSISPGQETYQQAYAEASKFAANHNSAEKFENGILDENLTKHVANNLRESDRVVTGLENPRRLILDAFEAKKGDILDLYEFGNRFVLVEVTEVREEGIAPLDQVYGEVEGLVLNKAKGEYLANSIAEKLSGISTIEDLAVKMDTDVRTAAGVTFGAFSIPGIGVEPALSATMLSLKPNEISKPIVGNSGVYVIVVDLITEPEAQINYAEAKTRLTQSYVSRAGYQAFQALEKASKVVDKRNKFY